MLIIEMKIELAELKRQKAEGMLQEPEKGKKKRRKEAVPDTTALLLLQGIAENI